jgi:hypothetical protein
MKSFTGKNLRANIVVGIAKRASKYLPMIQVTRGEPPTVVKIPSLYSDSRIGFGRELEKSK